MNKEKVEIKITGTAKTGKSTLSYMINELLKEAGLNTTRILDEFSDEKETIRISETLKQRIVFLNEKGIYIEITEE